MGCVSGGLGVLGFWERISKHTSEVIQLFISCSLGFASLACQVGTCSLLFFILKKSVFPPFLEVLSNVKTG